jgi:transcriptional regulator with XRE-family HTH domain
MSETMFFQRLTKLCEERGISVTRLAKEIGKGSATATGWKKGAPPRSDTLKAIADYFDVPVRYLKDENASTTAVQTNHGAVGNFHAPVTISNGTERTLSDNEIEMFRMFAKLTPIDQAKAMVFTSELLDKQK